MTTARSRTPENRERPELEPELAEALARGTPDAAVAIAPNVRLTVAQASRRLGIGQHTLRYYERQGLVRVPRGPSGHREYGPDEIRRVEFVRRMRTSGMSMSRLRRYTALVDQGDETVPQRLALMHEHREAIVAQLHELQVALAATDYKIGVYGGMLDGTCIPPTSE